MRTIHKYRLPFKEIAHVDLPVGAEVIRIDDCDSGAIWLWAIVDTTKPFESREFLLFKTGSKMPDDVELRYLGCGAIFVQMELMMYVFERVRT